MLLAHTSDWRNVVLAVWKENTVDMCTAYTAMVNTYGIGPCGLQLPLCSGIPFLYAAAVRLMFQRRYDG